MLLVISMEKLIVVNRVFIFNNDKVLLVKNRGNDFWCLPGGKLEPEKESLAEGCAREIKEELGINISSSDLLMIGMQEIKKAEKTYMEFYWRIFISDDVLESLNPDTGPEGELDEIMWANEDAQNALDLKPGDLIRNAMKSRDNDINDMFLGTIRI